MNSKNYDLPPPFDTFQVEKYAGESKKFGSGDEYPLKGVTYPVDYGDIKGYIAEDGANLDFFVGTEQGGLCGYIKVYRPELADGERKFYVNLSDDQEAAVLNEFSPVILQAQRYDSLVDMKSDIERYRINDSAESHASEG